MAALPLDYSWPIFDNGDLIDLSAAALVFLGGSGVLQREEMTLEGVSAGAATITVTAEDPDGARASDSFAVSVSASQPVLLIPPPEQTTNRAPTLASAIADIVIVNESRTRSVSLAGVFSDADGDALTITAASSDGAVATVSTASDGSSLTVAAKSQGTATITVAADDGNGGAVADSFSVTVKTVPDVASRPDDIAALAVGDTQEVSLAGVFSDADGDALTITAASDDETVAAVTLAPDGSALTVAGASAGEASITMVAQDPDGNQVIADFGVAVVAPAPQQQAPEDAASSEPETELPAHAARLRLRRRRRDQPQRTGGWL